MPEGLLSRVSKANLLLLCIGLILFLALMLVEFLTSVVVMLAAVAILAYLLMGPVRWVEKGFQGIGLGRWARRPLAIIMVYLLFFGLLSVALVRIVPPLSMQIREFAQDIPTYFSAVEKSPRVPSLTPQGRVQRAAESGRPARLISATAELAVRRMANISRHYASRLGEVLIDVGATTLASLVYIVITLVLVFILLADGQTLRNGFINLMPLRHEKAAADFIDRLDRHFHSFIQGQVLMSILAGGLMYVLLLLLGIKYALMLGFFFALASILPVIGPWMGLIPITIITAFSSHPAYILQILFFSGLFYLIKTYWLWPNLMRNREFDIHPIIFIVTFIACLKMVGYLGILLSFPLASILGVAVDYLKARHQTAPEQTHLLLE